MTLPPPTLIVLADGTGNAASNQDKTNVWRLYESLDLSDGQQLALYDDGVGTAAAKALRWIGLGFGLGVKRNVLQLYMFLCEHYKPGSQIYAFGFSRGAFTIRLLVALIQTQGLVAKGATADLPALAGWAYRRHRRAHGGRVLKFLLGIPRLARNLALRVRDRVMRRPRFEDAAKITAEDLQGTVFVGAWDTVDAYGISVDMVARGVDAYVTPLRFSQDLNTLPGVVGQARHALSLDDERTSFHPLLWDDAGNPNIRQVWFAGVHADVGGGYPDHSLSLVSLNWMIAEASAQGLLFRPAAVAQWVESASYHGPTHDSRQDLWASYYRYGPRSVPGPSDTKGTPQIHASVLQRIAALPSYSPLALPRDYAVVGADSEPPVPVEAEATKPQRVAWQERARDLVWMRKTVYLAILFLTVLVASAWCLYFFQPPPWPLLQREFPVVGDALHAAGQFAPTFFSADGVGFAPAVAYYALYPLMLIIPASLILAFRGADGWLRAWMNRMTRDAWAPMRDGPVTGPSSTLLWSVTRAVHANRLTRGFEKVAHFVVPLAVGLLIWLGIIGPLVNRLAFDGLTSVGAFCTPSASSQRLPLNFPMTAAMTPHGFCQPTGLYIESGAQYLVTITLPTGPDTWFDQHLAITTPAGLSCCDLSWRDRVRAFALTPYRRIWRGAWLVPVARIGNTMADHYLLTGAPPAPGAEFKTLFTARRDGELFLFVNEALTPLLVGNLFSPGNWGFGAAYANNRGGNATLVVEKVTKRDGQQRPCSPDVRCEGPNKGRPPAGTAVRTSDVVSLLNELLQPDRRANIASIVERGAHLLEPLFLKIGEPVSKAWELARTFFEHFVSSAGDEAGRRTIEAVFGDASGSTVPKWSAPGVPNDTRVLSVTAGVVHFDLNSAVLPPSGQNAIQVLLATVRGHKAFWLLVGSTDRAGSESRNTTLATDRTRAVADYLAAHDIDRRLIIRKSLSELAAPIPGYDGGTDPENRKTQLFLLVSRD